MDAVLDLMSTPVVPVRRAAGSAGVRAGCGLCARRGGGRVRRAVSGGVSLGDSWYVVCKQLPALKEGWATRCSA